MLDAQHAERNGTARLADLDPTLATTFIIAKLGEAREEDDMDYRNLCDSMDTTKLEWEEAVNSLKITRTPLGGTLWTKAPAVICAEGPVVPQIYLNEDVTCRYWKTFLAYCMIIIVT